MTFRTKAYLIVNLLAHNPGTRFRFHAVDDPQRIYTAQAKQLGPRHKREIEVENLKENKSYSIGLVKFLRELGDEAWYNVVENI